MKNFKVETDSFHKIVQNIKDGVWLASLISVPLSTILFIIVLGIWSLYGDSIIEKTRDELGIEANYQLILKAIGEDRVISQPPLLSYVVEPVYAGEILSVKFTIKRTDRGSNCWFMDGSVVYLSPSGSTITGGPLKIVKQVGIDLTNFKIQVEPPNEAYLYSNSESERWLLYLILNYDCSGRLVSEKTYPMPFTIMKKE